MPTQAICKCLEGSRLNKSCRLDGRADLMTNKPSPLNRDYNRDPKIKAPERKGFIHQVSTSGLTYSSDGQAEATTDSLHFYRYRGPMFAHKHKKAAALPPHHGHSRCFRSAGGPRGRTCPSALHPRPAVSGVHGQSYDACYFRKPDHFTIQVSRSAEAFRHLMDAWLNEPVPAVYT